MVHADDHDRCSVAALQDKAPSNTTIESATIVAANGGLPEHCLVTGSVATPGNRVGFQVGWPRTWNGKFLFQGVGGFAGSFGSLREGLQRGYATATTDTGHKGTSGTDGKWALNDRAKEIDYGHRGTHVSVVATKELTRAYYGSAARFAYFNGCSNGGRQALMEAQRYPTDFNGIIAGDPSFGALGYVRRALIYQTMLASPERALPPEKLDVLSRATLAACDRTDGLADGLVGDPRLCRFDPAVLECKAGDAPDCLTKGQIETVKAIYETRTTPDGRAVHGFPVGHEAGATGWQLWISGRVPPTRRSDGKLAFNAESAAESPTGYRFADGFFRYMAFEVDDPSYDFMQFDLARDLPKIQTIAEILSPTNPDLSAFRKNGGKLILYHGWADPAISAYGTIDYYEQVVANAGGKQVADGFVRLFLAPGMHHCRGGPGPNTFDALAALEEWVERGIAPARLIASHATDGKVDRTRPLCPEPQVARYIGQGSIDDAANFRCETPARPR
ncbi:MAG TPA: tannase/feruloyl esterase family alpha/beta hydrolase [Steroidobacteraceae bacterium]